VNYFGRSPVTAGLDPRAQQGPGIEESLLKYIKQQDRLSFEYDKYQVGIKCMIWELGGRIVHKNGVPGRVWGRFGNAMMPHAQRAGLRLLGGIRTVSQAGPELR
jgi:hypothetical protein